MGDLLRREGMEEDLLITRQGDGESNGVSLFYFSGVQCVILNLTDDKIKKIDILRSFRGIEQIMII